MPSPAREAFADNLSDAHYLVALATRLVDEDLDERPLLRQAIVVGCAATETYLGDRVMELVGDLMNDERAPKELRQVPLTLGDWFAVDATYSPEKKNSGLRYRHLGPVVAREVSTHPRKVVWALRLLGHADVMKRLNSIRRSTDTEAGLIRITERRNKIAHAGDRRGRGKAKISVTEVEADLKFLESVVDAVESLTAGQG